LAAGEFPDLFPEEPVKTPRTLAVLADQILALYHELELGSGNLNISSVNEKLNGADRNFPDLAELERRYLEKLSFHSLTEPFQQQIDPEEEARYFLKFRKIIVAACPDLSPFAREKLIRLQQCFEMFAACGEQVPQISICITAPASWCDCFDSWGCLIPEQWDNVVLPFAPGTIHSVPDVREMADLAAKLSLTERVDEMGGIHQELDCADTAVVVTHPDFFADLEKAFSGIRTEKGERLSLYNPDGVSMGKLRLVTFCRTLCDLMDGEKLSFEGVRTFLRQEYVLEYFAKSFRMSADHLLKALDIYYLIRLPDIISIPDLPDVQVLAKLCRNGYPSMETACIEQGNLLEIFRRIDSFREKLLIPGQWIENLRILCTEVFSLESYPEKAGIGLDEEAAVFREILSGLEKSPIFTSLDPVTAMLLFTGELSRGKLYADHPEDSLEITGFLDMPFRNASRVILCGMSEGLLPERTAATPYLNDELRKLLSLPDSDAKYARDCFYVRLLLDKTAGNVHFISPKINSDKSLLGFSPFYFTGLKNPEEILKRCGILFENYPIPAKSSAGKNIPFHAFADLSGAFRCGDKTVLSVTGFSVLLESYLYAALANIYGIGETAYDFPELDASVQGTIVHAALQKFSLTGEQLTSFRSGDPVRKNKALTSAFEDLNELFLEEVYRRCGR
ncbi:MAG: hypothetical protein J6S58_07380, partial [Lentisphaeria bacterium]|nr:hypothetical protein [Lentisphaeria bacterium]